MTENSGMNCSDGENLHKTSTMACTPWILMWRDSHLLACLNQTRNHPRPFQQCMKVPGILPLSICDLEGKKQCTPWWRKLPILAKFLLNANHRECHIELLILERACTLAHGHCPWGVIREQRLLNQAQNGMGHATSAAPIKLRTPLLAPCSDSNARSIHSTVRAKRTHKFWKPSTTNTNNFFNQLLAK